MTYSRNCGPPIGSDTTSDADAASFNQADNENHSHSGAGGTIVYCGDPARVREGFMIALDILEAASELPVNDAPVRSIGRNRTDR